MAIRTFQANLSAAGQFDFLDTDISKIKGGEVVVFDTVFATEHDRAAAEEIIDGYRTVLRLATGLDTGPFFFADGLESNSFPQPAFEITTLYATQRPFARNTDASGKVAVYGTEGFYCVSVDVLEDIDESTQTNSLLYVSPEGFLTTTLSASGQSVGYFIQYRHNTQPRSFTTILPPKSDNDFVIIYKSTM